MTTQFFQNSFSFRSVAFSVFMHQFKHPVILCQFFFWETHLAQEPP